MDIRTWFKPDIKSKECLTVYTDGSAINNGKTNCTGGIGVFFCDNDDKNISKQINIENVTNNKCELIACIEAIEKVDFNKYELNIYSDSEYVIKSITEWYINWEKKNFKGVKNLELIQKLYNYYKKYNINFYHIKAHKKEPNNKYSQEYIHWYGNMMADTLARKCQIDENKKI